MDSDEATVLVVDDERSVADANEIQIRSQYNTIKAYGGKEALEKINSDVDVVLLDRRMPDINGDDVLENIRDDGYNCRVVMVTAVDPSEDIIDLDFDDYLKKPTRKTELVEVIEEQLEKKRLADDDVDEFAKVNRKVELLQDSDVEDDKFSQLKGKHEKQRQRLSERKSGTDVSGISVE